MVRFIRIVIKSLEDVVRGLQKPHRFNWTVNYKVTSWYEDGTSREVTKFVTVPNGTKDDCRTAVYRACIKDRKEGLNSHNRITRMKVDATASYELGAPTDMFTLEIR